MWFLLAAHPEAQTKLGQELDSGQCEEHPTIETFPDYVYTRQVIDEALRLYPPLWLMSRKAKEDDYLGEYFVPAGTEIYISPYFIQRNPQLWEAPDRFDPDRMSIGNKPDRPELAFCPFGGPRKCIGDFFARVEIQMHLMMMARCLRFGACETIRPEFATGLNLLSKQDFVMLPEMRTQAFITPAGDAAIAAPHKDCRRAPLEERSRLAEQENPFTRSSAFCSDDWCCPGSRGRRNSRRSGLVRWHIQGGRKIPRSQPTTRPCHSSNTT